MLDWISKAALAKLAELSKELSVGKTASHIAAAPSPLPNFRWRRCNCLDAGLLGMPTQRTRMSGRGPVAATFPLAHTYSITRSRSSLKVLRPILVRKKDE
ncbi:uncharacterized protein Dsimw501_GD27806 [Drosophila simulans]|uniref:Uncharacterized protein n=1 Tax=Drosophila simulans TaxID=7240 RepID=A0A0J9RF43_DROSI|nr:uncharacterized protein Dsimw501_GD27806 [Drosophila simulans]